MARETTTVTLSTAFAELTEAQDEFTIQNIGISPVVLIFAESIPVVGSKGHVMQVGDVFTSSILGQGVLWGASVAAEGLITKSIG